MKKSDDSSLGKSLRSAEKKLAKGLMKWKFKRVGLPIPDEGTMESDSERIVDEAHRVMKGHAKSIVEELKQAKQEFLKAYRDNEEKEKE